MITYSEFHHEYTKSYYSYKEPLSKEYCVFLNGKEIPVYTCRISKDSFNRVWPGYQRSAAQTELVSFVNIVSDEAFDLTVQVKIPYEKVLIKPYSRQIDFTDRGGEVSFSVDKAGTLVLMADKPCHSLFIFNSLPQEDPGEAAVTHYFGPGVHMPGKVVLHDNESVYVHRDALVFGSIYAENAKNLHIFGNGIFDDSCEGRIDNSCYEPYTNGNIKFYDCENIRVEGVLFRDSAIWCVNLFHCFDVILDDIKVFGQWRYNTDGIDIVNSRDITVKNSFIHSFDDTITIKGIDRYAHTSNENIFIDGCILWNDWGQVCELGIETLCREYKNIAFTNCDILRAGTGATFSINNGECAEVSQIRFENNTVEYNSFDRPAVLQQTEEMIYDPQEQFSIPDLIRFRNARWRTESMCDTWGVPLIPVEVDLTGIKEASVHDVTVRNITVYFDESIPLKDGKYPMAIVITSLVENVSFHNIHLSHIRINGVEANLNNIVTEIDPMEDFTFQ